MIISDIEATERYESPLNLLNRLKSCSQSPANHPAIPPTSEAIIDDLQGKLNTGSSKSKALNLMNAAIDELRVRLPEVSRPEKLASIAADMSKIVTAQVIKNENNNRIGQIIVYAPKIVTEDRFEVCDFIEMES